MAKNKSLITKTQFDAMLAGVESQAALAFASAKSLCTRDYSARDIAMQRRINSMVELAIANLEDMAGTTVACSVENRLNSVPFPVSINRSQTLLNFDNQR